MRMSRADLLQGAAGLGASLALGTLVYIAVSVHDVAGHAPGAISLSPPASSSAPAVVPSSPPSAAPSPPSSLPPASLSPVLAFRITPGTATALEGPGAGSAGSTGNPGDSGGGGGGGSQPSQPPVPQPSPKPSPSHSAQTCITVAGAPVCVRGQVQARVTLGG